MSITPDEVMPVPITAGDVATVPVTAGAKASVPITAGDVSCPGEPCPERRERARRGHAAC